MDKSRFICNCAPELLVMPNERKKCAKINKNSHKVAWITLHFSLQRHTKCGARACKNSIQMSRDTNHFFHLKSVCVFFSPIIVIKMLCQINFQTYKLIGRLILCVGNMSVWNWNWIQYWTITCDFYFVRHVNS